MKFFAITSALATIALQMNGVVADTTSNPGLVSQLKTSATQLDRLSLLSTDDAWTFDFHKAEGYNAATPGSVVNANAASFPAVTGNGMTMALLSLGPCSMLPPHYHPRAANFVVAVNGTTHTLMIEENGARPVSVILTAGKMTIFPQASLHTMQNLDCTPSVLVSTLNNEDQGTHNVANGLFSLPSNFLEAAFGGMSMDFNETRSKIPPVGTGAIYGDKECMKKCGISYPSN